MPVSDELLLKLIYQEENQKLLSEASAQFEKMTQAEKDLIKQNDELKDSGDGVTSGFSKMQAGIVTLNAGMALAQQAIGTFKQAWDFVSEGAAIERINQQFNNMAASVHVDAQSLLADLQAAAHGTVDSEALMQTATRAMALGITSNTSDLVHLLEIARASSVAFGGDTESAFERITSAVENLTPRLLKQSGIIVDLTKAYHDYAAQIDKDVSQLTDEDKRQALLNETLTKGADLVKKIGAQGEDTATRIEQVNVRIKETGDSIKEWGADVLSNLLNITDAIGGLASADSKKLIEAAQNSIASLKSDLISGKITLEQYNAAVAGIGVQLERFDQGTKAVGLANSQMTEGMIAATRVAKQQQEAMDALAASNQRLTEQRTANQATNLGNLTPEQQKAATQEYKNYQGKLADIELKGAQDRIKAVQDANDSITKIEESAGEKRAEIVSQYTAAEADRLHEMQSKRIDILTSYADAEQKITEKQNQERMKLARNYSVEIQRAEEDHQIAMQRLTEAHTHNMRRLAESRDALGIEDEQEKYETDRRHAEEDYQVNARRRNEDYAQQLADQMESFAQQRATAADARNKQLADLKEQFVKQDEKYKTAYTKQLTDLDKSTKDQEKAVWDAEGKKLSDLQTAQANERTQADTQWQQWRDEHELFFAGEKKLYDDYLKYTYDKLQTYLSTGGGTTPLSSTPSSGAPFRAAGGPVDPFGVYTVGERGPERLYMGRQGGYIAPNKSFSFSIGAINIGGTSTTPAEISQAVYAGIVDVVDRAMRQ